MQFAFAVAQALGRHHVAAVCLRGQHGAGFHRPAIEQDRARATGRRVAAHVGRGQSGHVPQEMDQQRAVGYVGSYLAAVDSHCDLHRSLPFSAAALIAAQTLAGVSGMSMWRTPRWLTASMTEFCTAGVAPIVPASPMPLTPSGLMVAGVSLVSSSKLGSSVAVMMA